MFQAAFSRVLPRLRNRRFRDRFESEPTITPWILSPRSLAEADVDTGRRSCNFHGTRLAAGETFIFPLKLTDLPQSCGPDYGGYTVHASPIWVLC